MAINATFVVATPERLVFSLDGDDAALQTISNATLTGWCVDGPLKAFLQKNLSGVEEQAENLSLIVTPGRGSGAGAYPDANNPAWLVSLEVEAGPKTNIKLLQTVAPADGSNVFTAQVELIYIHSLVR
jgi:hypothetical protein